MNDDLKNLIDGYLDGTLDEAGHRELERRLSESDEARQYFVRFTQMHADLYLEAKSNRAMTRAMDQIPSQQRKRSWAWTLGVAASVLLAVGLGWWLGIHRSQAEPVAWLVNAQDCQWTDGRPPEGGLQAGTTLNIDHGLAEIHFRKGTRVVINGPARLELLGENSARLHRGRVSANVPEEAIGFELLSPKGKVIDLGTEFGVRVEDDGTTDVAVFKGMVDSEADGKQRVRLHEGMAWRIGDPTVGLVTKDHAFVRSIIVAPVIEPKVCTIAFRQPMPGTILDVDGRGTGLSRRLAGTGSGLAANDPNLRLNPDRGLELTTTRSDINGQVGMATGEYLGVALADLGFTGAEDFEIAADFPHIPALRRVGQFGVYAGTRSDKNIRGGLISKDGGEYRQNIVNNNGGKDADSVFVGLSSTGDDMRVILKRIAGKFSLAVENRTRGTTVTLATKQPTFLDGDPALSVGVFGANTQSDESKTLAIRQIQVTVWKARP